MARLQIRDRNYIDPGEPILPTKGLDWPPNDLCVRFVNTAEPRTEPSRVHRRSHLGLVTEPLNGYDAIVRWMGRMKALTDAEIRGLLKISDLYPPDAIEVATRMTDLRVLFGRMASSLANLKAPSQEDRGVLRDLINEHWQPLTFELDQLGGVWTCEAPELSLERPYRQLVFSMARLLTSRARNRVRRCRGEGCTLLFVHNKRGRIPFWCHKDVCGEKVRERPSRAWDADWGRGDWPDDWPEDK